MLCPCKGCARSVPGNGFGPADIKKNFSALATHITGESGRQRAHQIGVDFTLAQCVDAGVYPCQVGACGHFYAIVGKQSSMQAHLANSDAAHKDFGHSETAENDGGRSGWLRRLRGAAAVGSPAHFFNTVLYVDNRRRPQIEKGLKSYRAAVATRAAQGVAPPGARERPAAVSYTHLRAHET